MKKRTYELVVNFDTPLMAEFDAFDTKEATIRAKMIFKEQFPNDIETLKNWDSMVEINELFTFSFDLGDLNDFDDPTSGRCDSQESGMGTTVLAKNLSQAYIDLIESQGSEWLEADVVMFDAEEQRYIKESEISPDILCLNELEKWLENNRTKLQYIGPALQEIS